MKKWLIWLAKLLFSCGVLGFLVWKARQEESFETLWRHPKDVRLIALAGGAYLSTLLIQFYRWRLLALGLGLRLSYADAMRLGFLAQLFSLLGVGMLGGDALKTYILGRQNAGRLTEAFTSVFVDRVIGLYGLIVVAGVASLFFDPSVLGAVATAEGETVRFLCRLAPFLALGTTLAGCALLVPYVSRSPLWDVLSQIPLLGRVLQKLVAALRMYSGHGRVLLASVGVSFAIHLANAAVFVFLSFALPAVTAGEVVAKPTLMSHLMAASLAMAAGALPLGGLELVFNAIYRAVSPTNMPANQGFLVVVAFRLIQLCVASIGLYFYLRGKREVDQLLHAASDKQPDQATVSAS